MSPMGRGRFLGGCALLASLVLPAAAQELALGTSPRLTFERTNRRLPRTGCLLYTSPSPRDS